MNLVNQNYRYPGIPYLNSGYRRGIDLMICLFSFVPVHIILMFVWVALKLVGQRSFLYIQERVGRGGQLFRIYKVRTIRENHHLAEDFTHTQKDLLPIGGFLRRWRIDELPQIWNVLKGEMSWIGPRPEVPFHYYKCAQDLTDYEDRQLVLPGITGWAQIQNPNATADDNASKLPHDLYYLQNASLRLDALILLHTLKIYQY